MIPRKNRRSLINDYGAFNEEAQSIGYCFQNRLKEFISDNSLEYLRLDELENLLVSETQLLLAHMRLEQSLCQKKQEKRYEKEVKNE